MSERDPMTTTLLEVRNVSFSYGPLQVLFDVSIDVPLGGRVALLGTNGAGKSTLLKVVSGLLVPQAGAVRFAGEDISRLAPEARVANGMVQIAGGRATFPSLTVEEHLRMGGYVFLDDRGLLARRIDEVLELFPALRARLDQKGGTLSGGEQQLLALARALVTRPRLLMVDELSLGLAPVVVAEILRVMDEIVQRGTTLLIVEQSLNVATALTDQAFFMEKGEVRFSGPTADLLDRGDIARSVFFGAVS